MRRRLRRIAVVGVSLLAGCAPHLERPDLSIAAVQLVSATVWEQRLKVRLHVHNPNDRALPVKGIEYSMEVMGQQAASGQSDSAFVVPAMGDAEFDMSVSTNLAGALLGILSRGPDALSQEVPYRLTGKVSLSQGFLRSIPFDQSGTFRLQ